MPAGLSRRRALMSYRWQHVLFAHVVRWIFWSRINVCSLAAHPLRTVRSACIIVRFLCACNLIPAYSYSKALPGSAVSPRSAASLTTVATISMPVVPTLRLSWCTRPYDRLTVLCGTELLGRLTLDLIGIRSGVHYV